MKYSFAITLLLLFNSCKKDETFSCEADYKDVVIKYGKYYGEVKLNDSNNHWLMYHYNGNLVSFANDKGFQLDYFQKGYYFRDRQTVRIYTKGEKEQCVGRIDYEDFCLAKGEKMEYEPKGDGNIYIFERYLTLKWDTLTSDSFILTNKFEGLYFRDIKPNYRGGSYFYINKDTLFSSNSQKFHISKVLRNKEYKNVFELINTKADTTVVETKGYYFSYEQGLIGYYLTNNELWLKK